ncbi:MAG: glycosyltransferase [Nostoc sp. ChiQUE01a]|nr:glycosyltransferase [Nostoc sp. ChiQUE01a]
MVDVAFFDLPSYTRIDTTLGLVEELALRGEKVDYYYFEEFQEKIELAGAKFQPLPTMKSASPDPTLQSRLIEYCLDAVPILLAKLERDRPKLMVFHAKCLWAAIPADLLNIPSVCFHTNFLLPPRFLPPLSLLLAAYPLNEITKHLQRFHRHNQLWQQLTEKYAMKRINKADVFQLQPNSMNLRGDLNIVYSSELFQLQRSKFDDSYIFTGPCYGDRTIDPSFPLQEIDKKSIIFISLGSVTIYNFKTSFYERCLQAFEDSEYSVVMSVGKSVDITTLGKIPSNFIISNYVPQIQILQYAKVFITHGGTNSVWEGLINKVPMVVFPQGGDQYLVAYRLEQLGAGVWVKQKNIEPKKLRSLTENVMQNAQIRNNVELLGNSLIAAGGTKKAVDKILDFKYRSSSLYV